MIEWEAEATDAVGDEESNRARARQDEREWHAALALLLLLNRQQFCASRLLNRQRWRNRNRQEALAQRRRAVHGRKIDTQTPARPTERATWS